MAEITLILVFLAGIVAGVLLSIGLVFLRKRESNRLKGEFKDTFSALSFEALQQNADHFLKLAHETLGPKVERMMLSFSPRLD